MIYGIKKEHLNWTALIYAVTNDNKEIVELLLKRKDIDIYIKDILSHKSFMMFKTNLFNYI